MAEKQVSLPVSIPLHDNIYSLKPSYRLDELPEKGPYDEQPDYYASSLWNRRYGLPSSAPRRQTLTRQDATAANLGSSETLMQQQPPPYSATGGLLNPAAVGPYSKFSLPDLVGNTIGPGGAPVLVQEPDRPYFPRRFGASLYVSRPRPRPRPAYLPVPAIRLLAAPPYQPPIGSSLRELCSSSPVIDMRSGVAQPVTVPLRRRPPTAAVAVLTASDKSDSEHDDRRGQIRAAQRSAAAAMAAEKALRRRRISSQQSSTSVDDEAAGARPLLRMDENEQSSAVICNNGGQQRQQRVILLRDSNV